METRPCWGKTYWMSSPKQNWGRVLKQTLLLPGQIKTVLLLFWQHAAFCSLIEVLSIASLFLKVAAFTFIRTSPTTSSILPFQDNYAGLSLSWLQKALWQMLNWFWCKGIKHLNREFVGQVCCLSVDAWWGRMESPSRNSSHIPRGHAKAKSWGMSSLSWNTTYSGLRWDTQDLGYCTRRIGLSMWSFTTKIHVIAPQTWLKQRYCLGRISKLSTCLFLYWSTLAHHAPGVHCLPNSMAYCKKTIFDVLTPSSIDTSCRPFRQCLPAENILITLGAWGGAQRRWQSGFPASWVAK